MGPVRCKVQSANPRGRSDSSKRWLDRQERDPYVRAARAEGVRSRAFFKLDQIDDKYRFLRFGMGVIDLGAAPGGWTELACKRVNAEGLFGKGPAGAVVAVDLLPMESVPGAVVLVGDVTEGAVRRRVFDALGRPSADVVLSDMYPSTSGVRSADHARSIELASIAFSFARAVLAPGGTFLVKLSQGAEEIQFRRALQPYFGTVRPVKPPASRSASPEFYLLATAFRRPPSGSTSPATPAPES